MALPLLVNNSECGPSNPLQGLSKRFDHDRGIQQDHFGSSRAGSSREAFRTANNIEQDRDAARFFSSPQVRAPDSTFALGSLRDSLPAPPVVQHPQVFNPHSESSGWASDFLLNTSLSTGTNLAAIPQAAPNVVVPMHSSPAKSAVTPLDHSNVMNMRNWAASPIFGGPQFRTQAPMGVVQQYPTPAVSQPSQSSWDKEYITHEEQQQPQSTITIPSLEQLDAPQDRTGEGDMLSQTAAQLLENVKHEQNPKFLNSAFLGLMKKVRDREVVVEGNQMVENHDTSLNSSHYERMAKGKARDLGPTGAGGLPQSSLNGPSGAPLFNAQQQSMHSVVEAAVAQNTTTDANEAYFQKENEDYIKYWQDVQDSRRREIAASQSGHRAPVDDWGHLQAAWEQLEATSSEIKPISNYQFQTNNPYLLGDSSRSRHSDATSDSVLELEAQVQNNPTNATMWWELGVKQQENEREQKAIQALQRAIELDPTHLPAWLALAVSHTNDNNRRETYNAIKQWVERNAKYHGIPGLDQPLNDSGDWSMTDKFNVLVERLIAMARSAPDDGIDADVQIALAVILNTIDDYDKSKDCFLTALAVRPNDWLLYNRIGATLANSGHPDQAVEYYIHALRLNPSYIRARYNLGISCINLLRYEEGAQHVLDALVLQDGDRTWSNNGDAKGVTSNALWDTLKTCCMHMHRSDLSGICARRDLEQFRAAFTQG